MRQITLADIAAFLDRFFAVEQYGGDQGGVFMASERPVRRIGLALEPNPDIADGVERAGLDAVFLHRPWRLDPGVLPEGVAVLAYHLAFDERLTLGWNPRLADALGLRSIEPLGEKEGRVIGMIGDAGPLEYPDFVERVADIFGGRERLVASGVVGRIAVVGAMNDALVREASARGAQVYLSGQLRQPAAAAVAETGIGVIEVGHRRSELWGLRALAGVLRERWAALDVVLLE